MTEVLETAYHASFATEEGRPALFRLIVATGKQFPVARHEGDPRAAIPFIEPIDLTVAAIRRLSPATDPTQVAIGVDASSSEVARIWGLADLGSSRWRFIHAATHGGYPPPPGFPTITARGPGELLVSSGGDVVALLANGEIRVPGTNPLTSGPVWDYFESHAEVFRQELLADLGSETWDDDGTDEGYPLLVYRQAFERLLFEIRSKGHGGSVLVVPDEWELQDTRLTDRIHVKFELNEALLWEGLKEDLKAQRRYFDLHSPLWDAETVSRKDFRRYSVRTSQMDSAAERLSDRLRTVASMAQVDGAVVITTRLRVLGFGGEITCSSPSLREVHLATRTSEDITVPLEAFGTRHRSAFLFCSTHEDSVAFIVSSDGEARLVKRVGPRVVLCPDLSLRESGL